MSVKYIPCHNNSNSKLYIFIQVYICLVSCCSTTQFYHFRDNLFQMVNILLALIDCHCVPKPNYASNQLVFCLRLHFSPVKFFQIMPHVLDWIQVGRLGWSSPPINIVAPEKVGSIDGCHLTWTYDPAETSLSEKVNVSFQWFHRTEIAPWCHQNCRCHSFPVYQCLPIHVLSPDVLACVWKLIINV